MWFIHILSISQGYVSTQIFSLSLFLNQTGIKIFTCLWPAFPPVELWQKYFCIFKYSLQSAFLNDGIVFPSVAVPHFTTILNHSSHLRLFQNSRILYPRLVCHICIFFTHLYKYTSDSFHKVNAPKMEHAVLKDVYICKVLLCVAKLICRKWH